MEKNHKGAKIETFSNLPEILFQKAQHKQKASNVYEILQDL